MPSLQVDEVTIANMALGHITHEPIASFDQEKNAAASACKSLYQQARTFLLARYRWQFALRRVALAPDAEAPAFGFSYQFTLPADMVQFIGIQDTGSALYQYNYTDDAIPHKREGNKILADTNVIYLFYVADVTNPSEFDPLFTASLSFYLGSLLATALTGSPNLADQLYARFREEVRHAKRMNSIQGSQEIASQSQWVDSRFYGSGLGSPGYRGPRSYYG